MNDNLRFYRRLARINFPRSYLGKLMVIAFLGVHIPLLSIILYVSLRAESWAAAMPVLIVGVVATVVGSIFTMVLQHKALAPMLEVSAALNRYLEDGTLPNLPVQYTDQAGQLMANAHFSITHLDSLLRMKKNVLAILSHDLRNPITAVTLGADMMQRQLAKGQVDVERIQEYIDTIKAMSYNQLELINNTLTLVQTEEGKLYINPTPISPQRLLQQIMMDTRLQAEQKGIRLHVDTASASREEVLLDAAKMTQVITNLINNGIKFTPSGGKVTVTSSVNGDKLIFHVRDTGMGMDQTTSQEIFQPFTRAQRTGTDKESGTGLGLWICKTFVEAQGGQIMVDSQVGQGSCFTVILRRHVVETPNSATFTAQPQLARGALQVAAS